MNLPKKATAVFFAGVGKPLEAREYPLPERLEPGAVLVKTRLATVCGSDMHSWRGRRPFPTPAVLGHEGVGTIVRLGDAVTRDTAGRTLAQGDRVTWTIMSACGHCVFCRIHGLPQKCLMAQEYRNVSAMQTILDQAPTWIAGTIQYSWFAGLRHQQNYLGVSGAYHGADLCEISHGKGRYILTTMRIAENLGTDPVAERLFANLVGWARGKGA